MTPLTKVRAKHAELMAMPSPMKPSEWAEQYRVLSREANAKGGKFRNLPWQIEPVDALIDPAVQGVVMQWASQVTGKTETVNNATGYFIQHRPRPILNIQPTLEMAQTWSKDRLSTMIRDTPCLRGLIRESRSRIDGAGSTILHKTFPGGHLTVAGANSPAGLASRPIGFVEAEEVDRWEQSAGKEGDPFALALVRTESFPDAVWIMNSTPTIKGKSRIEAEMELTDKRKWFVPCPHCGKHFVIMWGHVKWPEDKPEEAYIECPLCEQFISDAQRIDMVKAGEWRATAPFKGIRGYWLNGIVCLFPAKRGFRNRLHQMVVTFLRAKKQGPQVLKTWVNTFLAETWEEEEEKPTEPEVLFARREDYAKQDKITLPERCVLLVCGADVQADRIESEIVGIGEGEETWGVQYRVFKGNTEHPAVWDEFDTWSQSKFAHVSGHELKPAIVMIDHGHKGKVVQAFCRRCAPRLVYPVKGVGSWGLPWVTRSKLMRLALAKVNVAKESIYAKSALTAHGPGYMHIPLTYTLEWCQQLMGERIVTRWTQGISQKGFEPKPGVRNEALDARVYAMAGVEILRPNYRKLALRLQSEAVSPENDPPEAPEKQESPVLQQQLSHKQQIRRTFPRRPTGWMRL